MHHDLATMTWIKAGDMAVAVHSASRSIFINNFWGQCGIELAQDLEGSFFPVTLLAFKEVEGAFFLLLLSRW